jgi:hypothetical protein
VTLQRLAGGTPQEVWVRDATREQTGGARARAHRKAPREAAQAALGAAASDGSIWAPLLTVLASPHIWCAHARGRRAGAQMLYRLTLPYPTLSLYPIYIGVRRPARQGGT